MGAGAHEHASLQEHSHPAVPFAWQVAPSTRSSCCAQWKTKQGLSGGHRDLGADAAAAQRRAAHGWARLADRTIVPQALLVSNHSRNGLQKPCTLTSTLIDGHRCRCARRAQTRALLAHHSEMSRQGPRAGGAGRAIGRSLAGELSLPRASCPSSTCPSALLTALPAALWSASGGRGGELASDSAQAQLGAQPSLQSLVLCCCLQRPSNEALGSWWALEAPPPAGEAAAGPPTRQPSVLDACAPCS